VDASGHLKAQEKMDLSYTPNLLTSILRSISATDSYEPDTRDGVIHRSRNILSCRVIACVSVHGWTMEKCRCTSSPTTLPDPSSAQWFTSTSAYILIDQGFVDNSEYKVYKQTVMCFPTTIAVWYLSPCGRVTTHSHLQILREYRGRASEGGRERERERERERGRERE
jgi:hypothetical protein